MREQEMMRRNLLLGIEFDKYLVEHPDLIEEIPQGAHVVLLPEDEPELLKANMRLARKRIKEGENVVFIKIKRLAPPRKSRIVGPRIEIAQAIE